MGLTTLSLLYILFIYSKEEADTLNVFISNTSGQPIYEQIYTQIKAQILNGSLQEGELLPSIRLLAKELRISVITTKRAYDELERDGFVNTVAGKGCFVAPKNTELIRETHLQEIEAHLQAIAELAAACDLSAEELCEMLRTLREERE